VLSGTARDGDYSTPKWSRDLRESATLSACSDLHILRADRDDALSRANGQGIVVRT
jgi:hypothetical protein